MHHSVKYSASVNEAAGDSLRVDQRQDTIESGTDLGIGFQAAFERCCQDQISALSALEALRRPPSSRICLS